MHKLLRLADGALIDIGGPVDLAIPEDADLMVERPALDGASVVGLQMPGFKNGQAFTQARLLRDRFGFGGEIRVGGHVLPDQAAFLRRCGASTIEIVNESRLEDFRFALGAYRYAYQKPVRGKPVHALREASS